MIEPAIVRSISEAHFRLWRTSNYLVASRRVRLTDWRIGGLVICVPILSVSAANRLLMVIISRGSCYGPRRRRADAIGSRHLRVAGAAASGTSVAGVSQSVFPLCPCGLETSAFGDSESKGSITHGGRKAIMKS